MSKNIKNNSLNANELVKYAKALSTHIESPKSPEGWLVCLDNAIELNQSLSLTNNYDEETIATLKEILELVETVVPLITDSTLKNLLMENQSKLREFFNKKDIQLSNHPSLKDITKQLADEITVPRKNKEFSEDWARIANAVKVQYDNPTLGYQFEDLDKWLSESLQRHRERQAEEQKRKLSYQIKSTEELSYEKNPERYFTERVLKPLADRLLRECKDY